MERRFISPGGMPPRQTALDPNPRHEACTRFDRERAHSFAESVARVADTLEETLRVADQSLIAGLSAVARGELPAGAHLLTKSLIASALAAWQITQLSEESSVELDHSAVYAWRFEAEHRLRLIPEHARLAASALRMTAGGDALLTDVRATTFAFVFGFGVARAVLSGPRLLEWQDSLATAFDRLSESTPNREIGGLGLPRISASARVKPRRSKSEESRPTLSAREREVLGQIVGGLTTAEVALRLGVKTTTVATLVGRIFNKLGVNNRAAAVAVALNHGLCSVHEGRHAQNT